MRVGLFITCLCDSYHPRAGIALVKVLRHLGIEVVFPKGQTCCGQPMANNGFGDLAQPLARRMVRLFAACQHVVTPSASCAAMVREHYPRLFGVGSPERRDVAALGERTFEACAFLVEQVRVDPVALGAKWEGSVTWHASCHLRGAGGMEPGEALLRSIPGVEYRPVERIEQCCGFGGTFATNWSEVSTAMAADKVGTLRATGADTLVSNDTGCTMNIVGRARRDGWRPRVVSAVEVLAEGLGLLPREDTGW